jgi:hypothetical protein
LEKLARETTKEGTTAPFPFLPTPLLVSDGVDVCFRTEYDSLHSLSGHGDGRCIALMGRVV